MKLLFRTMSFILLSTQLILAQSILIPADSVQLPQASIWGGISFNGENISVTTTLHNPTPHLYLRKLDTSLNQIGAIIPLTTNSDSVTAKHITDHKHLFLNGNHFITFSVVGDSDLYIFKVDQNGNRIGGIVPVVEHTANRTNDMMLCTDGEKLYVAYFKPGIQSVVHTLDQDLNQVASPFLTSIQLPHNNLGGMVFHNGKFYMFTGDRFGTGANLIITIWNHDWTPAISNPQTLISVLGAGEGLFFASGIAYDAQRHQWYVGFHHSKNNNPDAPHIDLAVFDENFSLLEHQHGPEGNRPHFLLLGDYLYMIYDRGGVFIHKYRVSSTTHVDRENSASIPDHMCLYQNYPNPFNPTTVISYQLPVNSHVTLKVYDTIGREVATLVDEVKEAGSYEVKFDAAKLSSGVYFARLTSERKSQTIKLMVTK